jgi:competence protein ComEA
MKYVIASILILLLGAALAPPGLSAAETAAAIPSGSAGENRPTYDLNSVGREDLLAIRGIGPALAERILDYRARHGAFSSVDELLGIKGIGEKSLTRLREHFTLTPPPSPVANRTLASP